MEANTIRDTLTPLSEEYRKGTIAALTSSWSVRRCRGMDARGKILWKKWRNGLRSKSNRRNLSVVICTYIYICTYGKKNGRIRDVSHLVPSGCRLGKSGLEFSYNRNDFFFSTAFAPSLFDNLKCLHHWTLWLLMKKQKRDWYVPSSSINCHQRREWKISVFDTERFNYHWNK